MTRAALAVVGIIVLGAHDGTIAADIRSEDADTLAQEYRQALQEQGQSHPQFRNAKTDEERKQAVEATGRFARRLVTLAERHPKDPLTLEIITRAVATMNGEDSAITMSWVMNKSAFPSRSKDGAAAAAMALLVRDHLRSEKLGGVVERMRYGTRQEYESFLSRVINESPHKDVRGMACLCLAQFLSGHAKRFDLLDVRPELAMRYEELLGKEYFDRLQRQGRDGRTMDIEALLEQAALKYSDVKMPWGDPVGEQARTALFEIRHLAVGKTALEIEGDDQDGKHLRLSDYRGKVVLLYFWSEY